MVASSLFALTADSLTSLLDFSNKLVILSLRFLSSSSFFAIAASSFACFLAKAFLVMLALLALAFYSFLSFASETFSFILFSAMS